MWSNNYIGIPFKYKGRTKEGLDCWGLARLIYKNEYDISLPTLSSEYDDADYSRIEDLIAQYKEGWDVIDTPTEGSIVLFKMMGAVSHIGVAISSTHFIHAREGYDSAIEAFDSTAWKNRIVGYFKYSPNKGVVLNAVPHPLKTERHTVPVPNGTKLDVLANWIIKEYSIAEELKSEVNILVNGRLIPKDKWESVTLKDSDTVEYRAVPTGGDDPLTRTLLTLAVIYVAVTYGADLSVALGGSSTGFSAYAATTAITLTGMTLVNYISPIRPPAEPKDAGSSERQLMVTGAQNRANPYGSIPVVLGKIRVTPPLGAVNYLTYENERDSYLSMLLVWGYGPLKVYQDSFRIGEQALSNYTDYTLITLDGQSSVSWSDLGKFNSIYGKDITQVYSNLELVNDSNPEGTTANFTIYSNVCTVTFNSHKVKTGDYVRVNFLDIPGTSDENGSTPDTPTGTDGIYQVTSTTANTFTFNIAYTNGSYQLVYNTYGPWAEAVSSEKVDSVTLAIHFPQGLRRIVAKGESAGSNEKAPVEFEIQYFYNSAWNALGSVLIGNDAPKKDAFTFTKTYSIRDNQIPSGNTGLTVRIRRLTGDNAEDNPNYRYYHTSVLQNVTFTRNAKPAEDPIGNTIAKSAFKIKATDQLNGSIEGINAIVQTYCLSWNGTTWGRAATSNPADLFRYILEHPANAQKVTNASEQIDIAKLQYWASYCKTNGFEYNAVLGTQKSILEVLRDICAAGRASPALVDGKWTVVIDEPKPNIIQHFTPHNSWGFESTKLLPKIPDGLRVTYYDQDQNYQEAEIIIYDAPQSTYSAQLFENISLPGVTKKSAVIDHAKWQMAQAKLRPEVYTLNTDIEYIVCNRGDRVKVMHDVPMWGLGSGRIKDRVSATVFTLDEDVPMKAGTTYTMRVRSADGTSVIRDLVPVLEDGYYSEVEFTTEATEAEVSPLDLFMFGEVTSEASDLIVISVEPTANKSARLTLIDYGITDTYNIFTDYLTLSSATAFESNITLPPVLSINAFGTKVPTVTNSVSDESVMEIIAPGIFRYNLAVSYTNAADLPQNTVSVEAQYDYNESTDSINQRSVFVNYEKGSISIPDVDEGKTYKFRLRYVSNDGRIGKWSNWSTNLILGKTLPPKDVTGFAINLESRTGNILFNWNSNSELDIKGYEVRTENANWGSSSNRVFHGLANSCSTVAEDSVNTRTYYIKAFDYNNSYSLNSASIVFVSPVPNPPTNLGYVYGTTSNTHSTVTFNWTLPAITFFAIKEYKVVVSRPNKADEVLTLSGNRYTTNADWLGNATLKVYSIDTAGSISEAAVLTVPKYAPNPISSFTADVVDNNVLLRWSLPEKTSLPIAHVLIKRGPTWETADKVIGEKGGTFTSIFELAGGSYTYWLAVVDTDQRESVAIPIPVTVSQPPDFVFNAEWVSDFNATKYNTARLVNSDSLVMLVNTTETWAEHFTDNSFSSPQAQIDAGYPVYLQPSLALAYYQEVFDYGQLLASSSITVSALGKVIAGTPITYTTIETSIDGITWSTAQKLDAVFATNFQQLRITFYAEAVNDIDLYQFDKLIVRLDNKQISDSGNIEALSTDTLGTIVNFNKEFIDIQSINLTAAGTTPLTANYDYFDSIIECTYSVTSGVCTVNAVGHSLETGQNVRLAFVNGAGINNIYTVTKISADQYTVVATGTPDTSGDVVTYSQSMRIYVFNSTDGSRQSTKVSWQIRGY